MTLDEIRALCEAASPGPWEHSDQYHVRDGHADGVATVYGEHAHANAQLIAAARTLLPALLEVAESAKGVQQATSASSLTMYQALDSVDAALAALEALKLP